MTRSTRLMGALILLAAINGAAQTGKPDSGRAELLKTDTEWAALAAKGKDVDRIVSYWADDAVLYPPGEAVLSGKPAIRKYLSDRLKAPWFSISWKPAKAVVAASGDVGYTMGSNEISVADAKGKVIRKPGRYLTVWRRNGGGPWRSTVEVWTDAPASFAPAPLARPKPTPRKK
jgi:ketosteroid isomerase-like protein